MCDNRHIEKSSGTSQTQKILPQKYPTQTMHPKNQSQETSISFHNYVLYKNNMWVKICNQKCDYVKRQHSSKK